MTGAQVPPALITDIPIPVFDKITCTACPGYCCYRLAGSSLLIDAADINRIARYFEISDGEVRRRYLEGRNTFKTRDDGACVLLADGVPCRRCTIHPARPRQCREFPYDKACPYLDSPELLAILQPRIDQSLLGADGKGCVLPLAEPDQPVKPPVS